MMHAGHRMNASEGIASELVWQRPARLLQHLVAVGRDGVGPKYPCE